MNYLTVVCSRQRHSQGIVPRKKNPSQGVNNRAEVYRGELDVSETKEEAEKGEEPKSQVRQHKYGVIERRKVESRPNCTIEWRQRYVKWWSSEKPKGTCVCPSERVWMKHWWC